MQMKRSLLVVLAVLFALAWVGAGFAAEMEKSVKITGDVISNDGKTMVVKGPDGDQTFDVSGVKNVNKYKPGDQVTISYTQKDGTLTAASISKKMIKGKKKKETKETENPSSTK
jgi:hypothetical protein